MLDQDPPDHSHLRSLVHQAFTPSRVEGLGARIETIANELAARAKARGTVDYIEDFVAPLSFNASVARLNSGSDWEGEAEAGSLQKPKCRSSENLSRCSGDLASQYSSISSM